MGGVSIRLILSIFAGVVGVALLISTEIMTQRFYKENSLISTKLNRVELALHRVENDLLKNTILLYYNYDKIDKEIDTIDNLLYELYTNSIFKSHSYKQTLDALNNFRDSFNRYKDELVRFIAINGSIKNSVVYIQALHLKAFDKIQINNKKDYEVLMLIAKISTTIAMAKNALDKSFVQNINIYEDRLKGYIPQYSGDFKRLLITFNRHLELFSRYFPLYLDKFNQLMSMGLKQKSINILNIYQQEAKRDLKKINYIIRTIIALYLLSLLVVIYFIFKVEKDYTELNRLHKNLIKSYITDNLTGLKNRQAFIGDKDKLKKPELILINIDRFQHINDYYGIEVGDEVLKQVAKLIDKFSMPNLKKQTYRLGGDDFGVLYDREDVNIDIYDIAKSIYEYIDKSEVKAFDIDFDISVTIGASNRANKLFETADMALKYAKRSHRSHIAIFNDEIDNSKEISRNITLIKSLKKSISKDITNTIVAYYQPMLNLHTNKIDHYEALARVLGIDDKILQPSEFMEVVKIAKMSGVLTTEILRQTLLKAKEVDADFGVNISAGDIFDIQESNMILSMLKSNKESASKIVFEILESEEITDYERVVEFISNVKKLGAKIAIDDFGSGYSNFEKILKLDIDYLKIDGSLIKRLDSDIHAELTVATIVTFSKRAGMKTIAEFVHNQAILNKVKELGIDYAQGYYIGKPTRDI